MQIAQAVLGIALLATAVVMIAGRQRLGARARRRGSPAATPTILWLFLGTLLATNGVLQLVLALA